MKTSHSTEDPHDRDRRARSHTPEEKATSDALSHEELIESRIELHDSNQFEVKLDYSISPERGDNHYRVEAYFFIPRSLGIDAYTYSRDQFYADMQAYIRFKTPEVALGALVDPQNNHSPLHLLAAALQRAHRSSHDRAAHDSISHELRMLGCLVRANLRDRAVTLAEQLRSSRGRIDAPPTQVDDVRLSVRTLLAELDGVMGRFRALRPAFAEPVIPLWIREVYQYVDEYLSLTVETFLTLLVETIDGSGGRMRSALTTARERLGTALLAERRHRRASGYQTVLQASGAEEFFIYRSGLLKKFVSSVLFLEISKAKESRPAAEIIAAVAAGVAMLFATIAGLVSQARWGLNSLPFVLALIGSYILKDRIKDWLKQYFSRKMTRLLADYDVRIRDPETGVVLGRCREAFSFLSQNKVPDEVAAHRHRDAVSVIEADSKPEVVMKYEKDVHLDGRVIGEQYGPLRDINDILRFNVSHFLVRTDDPVRTVRYYDPERDAVASVRCPKVYHVNVVFVLRAQEQVTLERVRVILDKRGIRRLEEA